MKLCLGVSAVLLLICGTFLSTARQQESEHETSDWTKIFKNIKNGVQNVHTYYTYGKFIINLLDSFSGPDGLCGPFQCPDHRQKPFPRPGHNPESNGCGIGHFAVNYDIPWITSCCNQHDHCYNTCGIKKRDCDERFQVCLQTICRNLRNLAGLNRSVQVCESAVTLIFDIVMYLGCKPYLDSQRAACVCHYEDKTDL